MDSAGQKGSEGICVGIRMRPLNDREIAAGQDRIFRCITGSNAIAQIKDGQPVEGQTYCFDKVFDENNSTVDVYGHIGRELVRGVVEGINGTIFAYGQTSSGKTHTMLGGGDHKGVINMAVEDIFNHIADSPNREFLLRASFVEIYSENIRDLLSDGDGAVNIREDPLKGVYCEASEVIITDFDSISKLLKRGSSRRAVESTAMNETSSRSHTIFKLVVESRESTRGGKTSDGAVLVAALNLVDLAGSESVRHTGAIGQRAKEGGKINQSLLSLSRVIHALSQNATHINYRDSKLTRLLQPSLSGNAKMSIVCCITSADRYLEETRSTLQFASRAKLVTTHATVNEVIDDAVIAKRLKKELEELKEKLRNGSVPADEVAKLTHEKMELTRRMEELEYQRQEQNAELTHLKEIIGTSTSQKKSRTSELMSASDETDGLRRSKRVRKTWGGEEILAAAQGTSEGGKGAAFPPVKTRLSSSELSGKPSTVSDDSMDTVSHNSSKEAMEVVNVKAEELQQVVYALTTDKERLMQEFELEIGANEEIIREKDNTIASLQSSLTASNDKITELEQTLDDANQTMHLGREFELMEQKAEMESELIKLKDALTIALNENATLRQEVSKVKIHHDAVDEAFADEKDSFLAQIKDLTAKFDTQSALLQEYESHDYPAVIQNLQNKLQDMAASSNTFETECNDFKESADTLSQQLNDANTVIQSLRAEIAEKDEQMAAIELDFQSQVTELQASLAQSEQAEAQLKKENAAFEKEVIALRGEAEGHTGHTAAIEAALFASQKACADLQVMTQAKDEEIVALSESMNNAVSQMSVEQQDEIENMRTELQTATSMIADLTATLQDRDAKGADLTTKLGEAQAFLASAVEAREESKLALLEAQQALQEVKHTLAKSEEAKQQLSLQLESSGEAMMVEYEAMKVMLAEREAVIEALNTKIVELQSIVEAVSVEKEESTSALVEAQQAVSSAEEAKQQFIARLESLGLSMTAEFEAMKVMLSEREGELSVLKNDYEMSAQKHVEAVASLTATIQERDAKVTALTTELGEAKASIAGAVVAKEESELALLEAQQALEEAKLALAQSEKVKQRLSVQLESSSASIMVEYEAVKAILIEREGELSVLKNDYAAAVQQHAETVATINLSIQERDTEIEGLNAKIVELQSSFDSALSEKEAATAALIESQQTVVNAEEAKEEINAKYLDAIAQLETDHELLTALEEKLANKDNDLTFINRKCSELESTVHGQQEKITGLQESLKMTINHQSPTLSRLSEIELTSGQIDEARREMQRHLETGQNEKGRLESDLTRTRKEKQELFDQLKLAEEKINSFYLQSAHSNESDVFFKKRVGQLQTQVDLLTSERDSLTLKLKSFESESKQRQDRMTLTMEKQEQEISDLRVKLEKTGQDSTQSQRIVESLKFAEQRLADSKIERDNLKHDLHELQEMYDTIYEEVVTYRQATVTPDTHAAEIERIQAVITDKDAALIELQEQLQHHIQDSHEATQRLKKSKEELSLYQTEVQTLTAEKDEALAQIEALTVALNEANSISIDDAGADNTAAAEQQIAALEETIHDMKTEINTLNLMLQSKATECEELEQACSQAHHMRAKSEEEVDILNTRIADLTHAAATAAAAVAAQPQVNDEELEQLHGLVKELEQHVDELTTQLDASHQENITLSQQMAENDKSAAEEQRLLMELAELQMSELRCEIENKDTEINSLRAELVDARNTVQSSASMEQMAKELKEALRTAQNDLEAANEHCAATETQIEELYKQLENKDKRIAHLDKAKLTADEMEKVMRMKTERKKFQEDARILKHQLAQLKSAYDDLKTSSANTQAATPSQEFVISDLRFQVAEVRTQLEQSQSLVKLLKDKIKECAGQLEDYEKERNAVILVLEKNGVDTTGMQPLDTSLASEDPHHHATPTIDLADGVSSLAQQLIAAQAALTIKGNQRINATAELEEKLRSQTAIAEDYKAQKVALERRFDALKTSSRDTREEIAGLTVEIEALRTQVAILTEELSKAEQKCVSSSDVVSNEVKVLEEENIELMQENKQLRLEVTRLKSSSTTSASTATAVSKATAKSPADKKKRAFGTPLDVNATREETPAAVVLEEKTSAIKKRNLIVADIENNEGALDSSLLAVAPSGGGGVSKTRRVKAKVVTAPAAEENPGDCKQS